MLYGVYVRQTCPRGHCEFAAQRQRPLVDEGVEEQLVVELTDSQSYPDAQELPHPPQCAVLVEMFTQLPPQQRSAAADPHEAPFARAGYEHDPLTQLPTRHGFELGHTGPEPQMPEPLHLSPIVHPLPSLHEVPEASGA